MQALLPKNLRKNNGQIEGLLTKFQNNLRTLLQMKQGVGTERDNDDLRNRIREKKREMIRLRGDLEAKILEYQKNNDGNLPPQSLVDTLRNVFCPCLYSQFAPRTDLYVQPVVKKDRSKKKKKKRGGRNSAAATYPR